MVAKLRIGGAIALAALFALPAMAAAVVSTPTTIDGPSASLVGPPQAAMSEDGTGGVAYLKNIDGRVHVFAAQFSDGAWSPSQRIDIGQDFNSSWPRIAAGNNGRLLVTWVQEFGPSTDRMYSATLDPGAGGFRSPVPVDLEIGKAVSTYPDLSMSRGGQAFLVYNVITDVSSTNPSGYVGLDVRLARYQNRLWSTVGSRIDRNATIPMRAPTAAIAPQVGTDVQGQAVVSWLEPDDEFIDRVWARRVFGGQTGIPLRVSPTEIGGNPLRGGVDAFSLDVAGFGQAMVAFRQQPGATGALDGTRVMVNGMPDIFTEGGDTFGTAHLADGSALGGVGAPTVGVDPAGLYLTAFSAGSATLLGTGDEFNAGGVERLDAGTSSSEGAPQVDLAETGAGVAAWREQRSTGGVLAVQERRADGVIESTALSARAGGALEPPSLGGSGLGDAIIAFSQGAGAGTQIAAAVVDAPPDPFLVLVPSGWQRKPEVAVTWDPAPSAIGDVIYSVSVDDEPVLDSIGDERAALGKREIEDGRHKIQIFALDSAGQETGSSIGRLMVDRTTPKVKVLRRGRKVSIEVSDGSPSSSSGLRKAKVSYGDGDAGKLKFRGKGKGKKGQASTDAYGRHRYDEAGTYRVSVEVEDTAGNKVRKRLKVRAR